VFQASVQDAHEPVGELAQCLVVFGAACSELVVVGACTGRRSQGAECLGHQRVDEPVVVHEPGQDGFLLSGGAGDRAGAGVVLAGFRAGIAVGVVTELGEYPGTEDRSQAPAGTG
jgi:hypothetical protein